MIGEPIGMHSLRDATVERMGDTQPPNSMERRGDQEHAKAVARRIRTGQVEVNGGAFNPQAPFGGYKQSGVGREYGRFGLEEFLEVKALQL